MNKGLFIRVDDWEFFQACSVSPEGMIHLRCIPDLSCPTDHDDGKTLCGCQRGRDQSNDCESNCMLITCNDCWTEYINFIEISEECEDLFHAVCDRCGHVTRNPDLFETNCLKSFCSGNYEYPD